MRRLAVAVLFVLLTAGCATAGSGSAGGPATSPAPSSTAAPAPSSTAAPAPSSTAAPAPSPTGSSIIVDGVVEHGVEPGCLVLRAGSKSYLLLRNDGGESAENVPVAVPVRVRGEVITGIASYCQQGTPLLVQAVTRR